MGKLEARLEQTEQEKWLIKSHLATSELAKLKVKWVELQGAIISTAECESASMEINNNLETNLRSKTEEATKTEEKRAKIEEHAKTSFDQLKTNKILKVEIEQLQSKFQELWARF